MKRRNLIGQAVAKLRFERGWTQDALAARLQCNGIDLSREIVANIESGRTQITDQHLMAFQKVFRVRIVRLFPRAVQELDEKLAVPTTGQPVKRPFQRR